MEELVGLKVICKLKEIDRMGLVKGRKESSAEHSWSCMMLAKYFLNRIDHTLDEKRIMDLLLYHDFVEVECGDTGILDEKRHQTKAEDEGKAHMRLLEKIPEEMRQEYSLMFREFEDLKTPEARFAKAIDHIEPMIHWLDSSHDWKGTGFTEEVLRKKKEHLMEPFPELLDFFNHLIDHLKQENKLD